MRHKHSQVDHERFIKILEKSGIGKEIIFPFDIKANPGNQLMFRSY